MKTYTLLVLIVSAFLPLAPLKAAAFGGYGAGQAQVGYDPADLTEAWRLLTVAGLKVRADRDGALTDLRSASALPGFDQMPDELRRDVLILLGGIEVQDDPLAALELLRQAEVVQPDENNAAFYRLLAHIGYSADRPEVVLEAMNQLVFRFPDQVSQLEGRDIQRAIRQAKSAPGSEEDRRLLLERLWEAGYEPPEPYLQPDGLWFELLLLYVESGYDFKARGVMASIGRPDLVAALRFDKRFERFTATYPAGGFRLSLQRQLEESRARAIANPEELKPVVLLAYDLLDVNRLAEALSVLDQTLAYLETFGSSEYADVEEQLPWIYNTRARVLMKQGKWEEALAAQQASLAAASQDGISQQVNLGSIYYLLQRPEEALQAIETIDESSASDYGRMAADEVRVCAYSQLGETGRAEKLLASMLARADDSFTVLKDALLCVDGQEDVLGRLVIERLSDPERRVDTLADLQNYLPPDHLTAFEAAKQRRWDAIRARPDVAAAIDKVGKVLDWPVFRPMT